MPGTVQRIEVFISGPSDVAAEREEAGRCIEQINRLTHISSRYLLVPHAFEESVPPVVGTAPQDVVDNYMLRASQADVFICILWQRFGTPTVDHSTGERFNSGTEYEFTDACRANRQQGKPHILLYKCTRAAEGDTNPEQARMVEDFFRKFEGEKEEFKGLYKPYTTVSEFTEYLMRDLDSLVMKGALDTVKVPVSINCMASSSGWTISFMVSEVATELLYKFEEDESFKSTGHQPFVDPSTGKPMAAMSITVPNLEGKYVMHVKYVNSLGITKGPYELAFDTTEEGVKQIKNILGMTPDWVSFRFYNKKLLVYFTLIIAWANLYKGAISEVRYSIDNEALSSTVPFCSDYYYTEIPPNTEYVAVQITYAKGGKSEVKRFNVPAGITEKDEYD
ncbi:MAG: hypothetical protein ACE5GF_07445 [Thermodesulfobacteriota bacterium]